MSPPLVVVYLKHLSAHNLETMPNEAPRFPIDEGGNEIINHNPRKGAGELPPLDFPGKESEEAPITDEEIEAAREKYKLTGVPDDVGIFDEVRAAGGADVHVTPNNPYPFEPEQK